MKYITKYKSPNYNSRNKSKIKLIIIHYTALKNSLDAISHLCRQENNVSSHYLISQDGIIYNIVDDKFRAWHAGQSFWQDITDINSISIGIELDYNPNGKNNYFSMNMMSSLKKLIINIKKKYNISNKNILGHSEISPYRKKDPGKHFPWHSFAPEIVFKFNKIKKNEIKIIEEWFNNYNIKSKKRIIIFILSLIGYDTRKVYISTKQYNKLINAYKSRYLNNEIYEKNDSIYFSLISHLYNFLLTKN
tara:strand:- start:67 stop:810 length:744 start_codon:yes stop_codon:yes gene_type:complete